VQGKTLEQFFAAAARAGANVEVHIDHPRPDYQRQTGTCYEAHQDFVVIGPEGAPARICLPYRAICWFRRLDDVT
jgi:hypothetical protein